MTDKTIRAITPMFFGLVSLIIVLVAIFTKLSDARFSSVIGIALAFGSAGFGVSQSQGGETRTVNTIADKAVVDPDPKPGTQ